MKIIEESLTPEVGPFYVIDGVVYGDTEEVTDVETTKLTGTKDSDSTHYGFWKALTRVYPEYRRVDYDYYPRGRIIYDTNKDEYVVYADKCLDNVESQDLIIDEFNLPRNKVRFEGDEHYQCHSCNPEYSDISENYER